jgi:hypothetical protein
MSVLFSELVAELTGIVPGYSAFLAKRDLNKAYRDILDRRTWSFAIQEGGFVAPALIQAGSVTVTQNSNLVVADATAAPALQAVAAATPPLTQRQFRIASAGAIYNITAWNNGASTLTLDRPIMEPSGTLTTYMVYQCYFGPPPQAIQPDGSADFNRWISVLDPINGFALDQDKSKAWLDIRDPQRTTTDLACYLFDYKASGSAQVPLSEFWPHPTSGQEYVCLYKSRGLPFTAGNQPLPQVIPDSLVLDRALAKYVYRWAAINAGRDPKLAKTNWLALQQNALKQWTIDLQAAKLEDDNVYLQSIVGPLRKKGFLGPVDSNFLQSHDMNFLRI